ncbi:serine O-acetyltransferase [Pseudomonas azerbaijanoccidentalis]
MFALIGSDIRVIYGVVNAKSLLKSLLNPSVHASILVRLAASKNKLIHILARNVLIFKHSIDVGYGAKIEEGLYLPHPVSIVIGSGSVIGKNLTIYQSCTIGNKRGYPTLEDGVTIFPNSVVVGSVTIGTNAVIGANSFVDKSLPPETKYRG